MATASDPVRSASSSGWIAGEDGVEAYWHMGRQVATVTPAADGYAVHFTGQLTEVNATRATLIDAKSVVHELVLWGGCDAR